MLALNIWEILREFGEILGKYRILDERSMGSIGITLSFAFFSIFYSVVIQNCYRYKSCFLCVNMHYCNLADIVIFQKSIFYKIP